ncbi:MAG TPA: hypothetical protein VNS34_01890 [Rhizobiaceae bacterium]|nr:hypothetical protein [Rhizobiaceae bacterium]
MVGTNDFELGHGEAICVPTIGTPTSQIKWSLLLNRRFRSHRINAVATPFDLPPDSLPGFLEIIRASKSVRGFSATIPHKISLVSMMDHLTPRATRAGAVNVVIKDNDTGQLTGDIIDGVGFMKSLDREGVTVENGRLLVVGGGGVARAMVASILDRPIASLSVADIDPSRTRDLARMHPRVDCLPVEEALLRLDSFDIVINATPLGMKGDDPLPFDPAGCDPRACIFDCVNAPGGTPLAHRAESRGIKFIDGSGMLELQLDTFLDLLELHPAPQ